MHLKSNFGGMPEKSKDQDTHKPLTEEEIISQVIELQKKWNEYVTEQTPDFLRELYRKNLLRFEIDGEGKIVVVFYIQPLDQSLPIDHPDQVFRIGGLSTSSSENNKRAVIKILAQLQTEVIQKNMNIISKTDNPTLARYLKSMGLEELTFEECKRKYPHFVDSYVKASPKSEEYYSEKKFYVRKA
jgi:hypothetical protein